MASDHCWGPDWDYRDDQGHAWVCADCKTHDTVKPHTPGPKETETTPQTCTDCGYILVPAKNHIHEMTLIEAVTPTCLTEECLEHDACTGCADWFKGRTGKEKIQNKTGILLSATGHTPGFWRYDQDIHWRECAVCLAVIESDTAIHTDENGDGTCHICGSISCDPSGLCGAGRGRRCTGR